MEEGKTSFAGEIKKENILRKNMRKTRKIKEKNIIQKYLELRNIDL